MAPITSPISAATPTAAAMLSSVSQSRAVISQLVTYEAKPKYAACPNESMPAKPSSRLKAHANMAKHSVVITSTG